LSEGPARPLRIVLLGPPASGKGTQGRRLAASLGLGYLSTGALLREQMEQKTALGELAVPILDRGDYLPDDLMCRILADWYSRQTGGWVLDGFPRSLPQALFLDELLSKDDLKLDGALCLEVPYRELLRRIQERVECPDCRWSGQKKQAVESGRCPKCGGEVAPRADDSEENFNNRYNEFERLTLPAAKYYDAAGLLHTCDATAPKDEVAAKILARFPS
jgi:adenylate kinase